MKSRELFTESLDAELRNLPTPTLCAVAAELLSDDLEGYCREAWHLVESTEFIPAMYWTAMCEWLMDVTLGRRNRVTITVPPRHGKSTLISVLWPTWEWARNHASNKWIFASWSQDLAIRDSVRRRAVIESSWYQNLFPQVQLRSDYNLKQEFMSTNHGAMFACWPGGALGRGANRLVIDDPHAPADMWSDTERESTINFVCGSLFSRLDNPGRDAIVVCHSRLHDDDLIGQLRNRPREETRSEQRNVEATEPAPEPVLAPELPYYVAGYPLPLPCNRPGGCRKAMRGK